MSGSAAFQRRTGYLFAQEMHLDHPELSTDSCIQWGRDELLMLGEPTLSFDEQNGMAEYFAEVRWTSVWGILGTGVA